MQLNTPRSKYGFSPPVRLTKRPRRRLFRWNPTCLSGGIASLLIALLLPSGFTAAAIQATEPAVEPPESNTSGSGTADSDPYPARDLPPLSRMVLYNSGVGQLQHRGTVDGNARIEIRFGDYAIDDVLKSLVFIDHGDGTARSVEYKPAPDPEDVAASTVGAPMTLAQLLQRFRGESIRVDAQGSQREGIIYGLENRASDEHYVETVVLLTDQGLQSIPLASIDRVDFVKPELRTQLAQAMQGLVKARKVNEKQIQLILEGTGEREVEFGYVIDMPIWRMTYRMAIENDSAFLQGWAHVDNITGVDWTDIEMELRSGRPYVWHANVFSPLRSPRPSVGNSVYEFSGPEGSFARWFGFDDGANGHQGYGAGGSRSLYGGGFGGGGGGFGGYPGGGGGLGGYGGGGYAGESSSQEEDADESSTFRAFASSTRDQQMVRYQIDHPVTIDAGRSAAIPVFGKDVPAKVVTIWRDDPADPAPPSYAVEITNESDVPFVAGPVSISRDGDFVGDARLPRLAANEDELVVFGVDRALQFSRTVQPSKTVGSRLAIENEHWVVYRQQVETREYVIENDDIENRATVILIPFQETDDVTLTPEPYRSTPGLLEYRHDVEAAASTTMTVSIGRTKRSSDGLDDFTAAELQHLRRQGTTISERDEAFLSELADWSLKISNASGDVQAILGIQERLLIDQGRMRENVQALRDSPEAAQAFVERLLEMETELESLRERLAQKHNELDNLRTSKRVAIEDYVRRP